jgi:hypothetical protein
MRHLTLIILIVVLVTLPSCKYFKGKKLFGKKKDIMTEYLAKQDSIRVADSIRTVQARLMALENARLDSVRIVEERIALEKKFRYNLIVGSFITPEYARALAEVYRQRGYDPNIIKAEGSRFEFVVAEAHESFRKAVARLQQFQDTVELDAWMYIRK